MVTRGERRPIGWEPDESLLGLYRSLAHKFQSLGYTVPDIEVGWDNAKGRGGWAQWRREKGETTGRWVLISISRYMPKDKITTTMLHEMTHVVLPIGVRHGLAFKRLNEAVGGTRYAYGLREEVKKRVVAGWFGTCPVCGTKSHFGRRPSRPSSCGRCSPRVFNPRYMLDVKYELGQGFMDKLKGV